ncbi:MAG: hypothetical protein KF774_12570 [Planctomyces sp.]|nr:hypothetical protein [Planctomyces sp.]
MKRTTLLWTMLLAALTVAAASGRVGWTQEGETPLVDSPEVETAPTLRLLLPPDSNATLAEFRSDLNEGTARILRRDDSEQPLLAVTVTLVPPPSGGSGRSPYEGVREQVLDIQRAAQLPIAVRLQVAARPTTFGRTARGSATSGGHAATLSIRREVPRDALERIAEFLKTRKNTPAESEIPLTVVVTPQASLLTLRADWSTIRDPEQAAAALREAVRGVPVAKDVASDLIGNARSLLFPHDLGMIYTQPRQAEQLIAWLAENELLLDRQELESPPGETAVTLRLPASDVFLGEAPVESETFVDRRHVLQWDVTADALAVHVARGDFLEETWRGREPTLTLLATTSLNAAVPQGATVLLPALVQQSRFHTQRGAPGAGEGDLAVKPDRWHLLAIRSHSLESLLEPSDNAPTMAALRLADSVVPLSTETSSPAGGVFGAAPGPLPESGTPSGRNQSPSSRAQRGASGTPTERPPETPTAPPSDVVPPAADPSTDSNSLGTPLPAVEPPAQSVRFLLAADSSLTVATFREELSTGTARILRAEGDELPSIGLNLGLGSSTAGGRSTRLKLLANEVQHAAETPIHVNVSDWRTGPTTYAPDSGSPDGATAMLWARRNAPRDALQRIADYLQSRKADPQSDRLPVTVTIDPKASLLTLHSDWSRANDPARVAAALEAAVRDVPIDDDQKAELLKRSGIDILFPADLGMIYSPARHADELIAWLGEQGLLITREDFLSAPAGAQMQFLKLPSSAVLPDSDQYVVETFVTRRNTLQWDVAASGSIISLVRGSFREENWRGREPTSKLLTATSLTASVPQGSTLILSALAREGFGPGRSVKRLDGDQERIHLIAIRNDSLESFLASPDDAPSSPKLRLADSVIPLSTDTTSTPDNLARLGGGANRTDFGTPTGRGGPPSSRAQRGARGTLGPTTDQPSEPPATPPTDNTPPGAPESAFADIQIFALRHAQAPEIARLLQQILRDERVMIVGDVRTNQLIVQGLENDEKRKVIDALLAKLDEASATAPPQPDAPSTPPDAATPPHPPGAVLAKLKASSAALDRRAIELANSLRTARTRREATGAQLAELQTTVDEAFNARQRLLEAELGSLADRIDAARKQLELRERIRPSIIERRVEDLLNPDLRWDAPLSDATPATPPAAAPVGPPEARPGIPPAQALTTPPAEPSSATTSGEAVWRRIAGIWEQAPVNEGPAPATQRIAILPERAAVFEANQVLHVFRLSSLTVRGPNGVTAEFQSDDGSLMTFDVNQATAATASLSTPAERFHISGLVRTASASDVPFWIAKEIVSTHGAVGFVGTAPAETASASEFQAPAIRSEGKLPSDYIDRIGQIRSEIARLDELTKTFGNEHPQSRSVTTALRDLQRSLDVLKREFEYQCDMATQAARSADASLERARLDRDRTRTLYERGAIAQGEVDRVESEVQVQEAAAAQAQATLNVWTEAKPVLLDDVVFEQASATLTLPSGGTMHLESGEKSELFGVVFIASSDSDRIEISLREPGTGRVGDRLRIVRESPAYPAANLTPIADVEIIEVKQDTVLARVQSLLHRSVVQNRYVYFKPAAGDVALYAAGESPAVSNAPFDAPPKPAAPEPPTNSAPPQPTETGNERSAVPTSGENVGVIADAAGLPERIEITLNEPGSIRVGDRLQVVRSEAVDANSGSRLSIADVEVYEVQANSVLARAVNLLMVGPLPQTGDAVVKGPSPPDAATSVVPAASEPLPQPDSTPSFEPTAPTGSPETDPFGVLPEPPAPASGES